MISRDEEKHVITIDALGQPCPIPVVRAKKAIAELPESGGAVEVMVDNRVACENLGKMADGSGYRHETRELPDGNFRTVITVGAGAAAAAAVASAPAPECPPLPETGAGLVVAIGGNSMGRGSEELGRILIKGFIYSLSQLAPLPQAVLYFNSGVKLPFAGAYTEEDIQALKDGGCAVWVCGTCVDYFKDEGTVAVGDVTNMYGIVEAMNSGARLISI